MLPQGGKAAHALVERGRKEVGRTSKEGGFLARGGDPLQRGTSRLQTGGRTFRERRFSRRSVPQKEKTTSMKRKKGKRFLIDGGRKEALPLVEVSICGGRNALPRKRKEDRRGEFFIHQKGEAPSARLSIEKQQQKEEERYNRSERNRFATGRGKAPRTER